MFRQSKRLCDGIEGIVSPINGRGSGGTFHTADRVL
jgi:hypothetical protein